MEPQIAKKPVNELREAAESNWQQDGGYKQWIFNIFCEASAVGVDAAPSADEVKQAVKQILKDDPQSFLEIETTLYEVCPAWNELI